MNCPICSESGITSGLTSVMAYNKNNIKSGGNRYKLIDFLYCFTCNNMFKMKIEPTDSRPKPKGDSK